MNRPQRDGGNPCPSGRRGGQQDRLAKDGDVKKALKKLGEGERKHDIIYKTANII
jgi:hypothetical protein